MTQTQRFAQYLRLVTALASCVGCDDTDGTLDCIHAIALLCGNDSNAMAMAVKMSDTMQWAAEQLRVYDPIAD